MSDAQLYAHLAAFDNATIIVKNTAELNTAITALSNADGGTILMDIIEGQPFHISAKNMAADSPDILIKPLDDNLPPNVSQIDIIDGAHLTITGMNINSAGVAHDRAAWNYDVNILSSNDINLVGNTMESSSSGYVTGHSGDMIGERAVMVRDSRDVTINHNTISDYLSAVTYLETKGLEISGNDISGIQGDGLRGGGIQDVKITDNYMHDFYGSTQKFNHTDMIQIWGTNASMVTQNVEISGNVLDAGNGAATQSILIQNENFSKTGYFNNIVIQDNIIHNGMGQGIGVNHITNLEVTDNTLLWNAHAETQVSHNSDMSSTYPRILLRDAPNATVTGNISGDSSLNGAPLSDDNVTLSFNNVEDPLYAPTHFVNLSSHGDLNLLDLSLRPDSPLFDTYGALASSAPYLANDAALDALPSADLAPVISMHDLYGSKAGIDLTAEFTLIDGQPIDPDTATVRWTYGDGTEDTGMVARHIYDTPGIHEVTLEVTNAQGVTATQTRIFETEDPNLVELDFADNAKDISAFDSDITIHDPGHDGFVEGRDGGKAFELTGRDNIQVDRFNPQLAGLDTFKLDIGFALSDTDSTGLISMLHETMTMEVADDGYLSFVVGTNDGYFRVTSDDPALTDTAWHDLSFVFDGPAGTMHIEMDGEIIGTDDASGSTTSATRYDLVLGSEWNTTVEGKVDHFVFSSPTSSLYDDDNLTGHQIGGVDVGTMVTASVQGVMNTIATETGAGTSSSNADLESDLFDILNRANMSFDTFQTDDDDTSTMSDSFF